MVILSALGCGPGLPSVTTISGLQVVAIETSPPEPGPTDALTLRTWVADGLGHGADVLVWSCLPVDGVCVEAALPVLPPEPALPVLPPPPSGVTATLPQAAKQRTGAMRLS